MAKAPEYGDIMRSSDGRLFFIPKGGQPQEIKPDELDTIVKNAQSDATLLRAMITKGPGVWPLKR